MEGGEEGTLIGSSLIKQLASCNKTTRTKSLRRLLDSYLPSHPSFSDDDMRKLWKGLFYCVWHSDKAPVQSALIERLGSPLLSLNLPLAADYLAVFLLTMRREWTGIDRLRLDKFYLLIRRFLHFVFVLLKKENWDLEVSEKFVGVLRDGTFFANDKFQGNGVNYHVASAFLEELRPFLPLRKEVVEVLVEPFVSVLGSVSDKVLFGKIKSGLFDVLLKMGRELLEVRKSGRKDLGEDVLVLGSIGLVMGFSKIFYELGSSADCLQGNRKLLFTLHEDFLKLEKDLSSSGIEISIPEAKVDEKEELVVSKLVPVGTDMKVDGSENVVNGKVLKKCKKDKKGVDDNGKKSKKKKKKKENGVVSDLNAEDSLLNKDNPENKNELGSGSTDEQITDESLISFNENIISNLQMQFEKVAEEIETDNKVPSACDEPETSVNGSVSKKRKRTKTKDGWKTQNAEPAEQNNADGAKSADKSVKKVRFSMKNNLVWKPQSPLPPQSLRLPPSVTPRGSALKKGVCPGPVREFAIATKKTKRAKAVKKVRKVVKSIGRKKLTSLTA